MNSVTLILCVVFAIAGYGEAQRFERQFGRTPWGLSAWIWALMLGLAFLIGLVLLAVAERMGRRDVAKAQTAGASLASTQLGAWDGTQWTSAAGGTTILPKA